MNVCQYTEEEKVECRQTYEETLHINDSQLFASRVAATQALIYLRVDYHKIWYKCANVDFLITETRYG